MLARLAERVVSIDPNADIIEFASANVANRGIENIEFKQLGMAQLDAAQSFDAIAVSGSMASVPETLKQLLKTHGRLFVVTGNSPAMRALLITRVGDSEWSTQSLFETDLPRLSS